MRKKERNKKGQCERIARKERERGKVKGKYKMYQRGGHMRDDFSCSH